MSELKRHSLVGLKHIFSASIVSRVELDAAFHFHCSSRTGGGVLDSIPIHIKPAKIQTIRQKYAYTIIIIRSEL